ncbi:MAG: hypothetical protein R3C29_03255 [Dehalococcoidia bacterium]
MRRDPVDIVGSGQASTTTTPAIRSGIAAAAIMAIPPPIEYPVRMQRSTAKIVGASDRSGVMLVTGIGSAGRPVAVAVAACVQGDDVPTWQMCCGSFPVSTGAGDPMQQEHRQSRRADAPLAVGKGTIRPPLTLALRLASSCMR